MKKLIAVTLVVLALVACIATPAAAISTTETITTDIDATFPEVTPDRENLRIYLNEVERRLQKESFLTDSEKALLLEKGFDIHGEWISKVNSPRTDISEYYYPVIFRDGSQLLIWYVNQVGLVMLKELDGSGFLTSNYLDLVHTPDDLDEEFLSRDYSYTITYSPDDGLVTLWRFQHRESQYIVPKGAEYCGVSRIEGYIFRQGTDVYALRGVPGAYTSAVGCVCIAHDVNYVITADYSFGSDPWSQPLFLLTDGSLKAYIHWEGEGDSDDPSHLCPPQYEGGYK